VSDIYIIAGQGTAASPIQATQIYLAGIGLGNYDALDIDGSIIGFYTTDRQFIILDPSAGTVTAGFPIGNVLALQNGLAGTNWNPSTVNVAVYVNGEDHAFYVSDAATGWYRLMPTPAPETGYTWSPYASLVGGCSAVCAIETSPGQHQLLIGPATSGPILTRDITAFTDNGVSYEANAVIGSAVLAQPGQVA
jgi:hypothetical protein